MERILIIDDDVDLCELLTEYLTADGFRVEAVHDGEAGLEKANNNAGGYNLIVLDVMLPTINGFEVLHRLRSMTGPPVIMLSARGEEVDRIVGLEIGADDYLPKPFNPRELVARIRAVLRRIKQDNKEIATSSAFERLQVGDVEIHLCTRQAFHRGKMVELTSVEFSLLETLLRSAGRLVLREELIRSVLGRFPHPFDRSIDVHVSKLRKKLGHKIGDVERIRTIRSSGYLYALTDPP